MTKLVSYSRLRTATQRCYIKTLPEQTLAAMNICKRSTTSA
jgi:hypothetical protein